MVNLTRAGLVLCAFVLTALCSSAQQLAPHSCSAHITSCGCVITTTGTYVVDNDLNANQTGAPNCIEVAADHSILNLQGFALLGNGTGVGILIRSSANHAVIEGGDEGDAPSLPNLSGGLVYQPASPQGVVILWNYGIEDDADDVVIGLFKQLGGNNFQQDEGNTTAGLLLKNAHRTIVTNFDASYNGVAGVIARNSSGLNLSNFNTIGNHQNGVWFDSSNDSTIGPASMASNHTYGLWLMRSSRNVVSDSNGTSGNGDTGILLGCGNAHCSGNETSDDNRVINSGAPGNMMNGIVVQKKSHNNTITITHNDGNPDGHDMVDENSHCDSNIWYNNTGTSNQSCIH